MAIAAGNCRASWLLPQAVLAVAVASAAALWPKPAPPLVVAAAAPYAILVVLFWCVRAFERAAAAGDAAAQGRLRLAVWLLSSALTVLFAGRVVPLVPGAAAVFVWGMSAATCYVRESQSNSYDI
uniref:PRA1 family protein n=1 Tax=Leersia perrieri TaxID=77586 RepID=A0A0D9WLT7_9ORYZ